MADKTEFDIAQAFADLNAKVDKLTPEQREEIADDVSDVETDVEEATDDDTTREDEFDAKAAIAELNAKVDKLLAQPRTKAVRTPKRNVPSAPARRPARPQPTAATPEPKKRRGWFPQ